MRPVPDRIEACQLTHLERAPIDIDRARAQHQSYCRQLADAGCQVVELPVLHDHPDSVFVEDTAVVLDELAVVCRPGAPSRRGECASVARALQAWRPLEAIEAPGTVDGGDVLVTGRHILIGRSGRTNGAGIEQFRKIAEPLGYAVFDLEVTNCLHLKSALGAISDDELLINADWVDPASLPALERMAVDPSEPDAANVLRVNGHLFLDQRFPLTGARLAAAGHPVTPIDASELAKAEGALTCCSLLIRSTDS